MVQALMEQMALKGVNKTDLSVMLGYSSHAGVSNRIGTGKQLDERNPRDLAFVARVCDKIGVQLSTVLERSRQIAAELVAIRGTAPDPEMAELMLNTLENPQAKPQDKATARAMILRMLGLKTQGSNIYEK